MSNRSSKEKKGVGLIPSEKAHYTDHLAVICSIMDIPLIFIEEEEYNIGKKYYPELNAVKQEFQEFNREYLIENFDVLFVSDFWDRRKFHEQYASLERRLNKRLRHVHCPHGFSDKGFYLKKCANEDIVLVYGQNMIDQFKQYGVLQYLHSYVISGNYRYTYYKKHKKFYDALIQNEVLSHFDQQQQPVILYAPTWLDLQESTTFFDAHREVIEKLPPDYNLIVKLHPRLEYDDTLQFYRIMGMYEKKPNVLFLKDFPPIYPLLAHTDMYIGDASSIGYDFLLFNKPMFFLNKYGRDSTVDPELFLFRCGTEIMPQQYSQLYQIIDKTLPTDKENFSLIRSQIYNYTFSEEKSFPQLKSDIIQAYNAEMQDVPTADFL